MLLLLGYRMTISADSDETKVRMACCAVPAAFSGGTLRAVRLCPSLGKAPQFGVATGASV